MKNSEKAFLCVVCALFAALLSGGASDIGGLWFVIVPVVLVMIIESIFSITLASEKSKMALWAGLLFHLTAAAMFFIGCQHFGHEIFEPFQYTIDYGHGNFEIATCDASAWWWLIVPLIIRVTVIEPIILIAYAKGKRNRA